MSVGTALQHELQSLDHGSHLCLVYDTPDEQARAAVPFIAGGLARGECCIYIVDERTAGEMRGVLAGAGIDVEAEEGSGALIIATQRETYLREHTFEPRAMVDYLRATEADVIARGFRGLRVAGELINLLSNAVKFTAQGDVVLSAHRDGDALRIAVRDMGLGIDAADHERIFEPFWQKDQTHSRQAGGTGLGLHVSRRLARRLGGEVLVESTLGAGAIFTLMLPCQPHARPIAPG